MPAIEAVRCILLSAPYGHPDSVETAAFYPSPAYRTTGMVEVVLSDGTVGLGEGYLAVFAPALFREIVAFQAPLLVGKEATDVAGRVRDLRQACDYWGLEGPVRHVTAAFEIALVDACARRKGEPAYLYLGGRQSDPLKMYASGGDALTPEAMGEELERSVEMTIRLFKMRSLRGGDMERCAWTVRAARERDVEVAVDLSQNLGSTPNRWSDSLEFCRRLEERTGTRLSFLEEAVGPYDLDGFRRLRASAVTRIAGGETLTSAEEAIRRVAGGVYDIVQPDATLMGIRAVAEVCAAARTHGVAVAVHAWGGPVGLMANYHVGLAAGAALGEYPMLAYALRDEMLEEPVRFSGGRWVPSEAPGLGVALSRETEERYPFRDDALYRTPGKAFDWAPERWATAP
jgi:L-alanine-DL-glutamate epimerase-like enolase superfamily enzyme